MIRPGLDDMYFDFRRVRQPYHVVLRKIGLLHAALLDRDFPVQGSAKREDNATFHLRDDGVRIDRETAVDHANDSFHAERRIDNLDLGYLRDNGMKTFGQSDTAAMAVRQLRAPL